MLWCLKLGLWDMCSYSNQYINFIKLMSLCEFSVIIHRYAYKMHRCSYNTLIQCIYFSCV